MCLSGFFVYKPPSGREVDFAKQKTEGAREMYSNPELTVLKKTARALLQSPTAPAFGPGRKHSLLPALAKNMPPAYFLNASRPLGGSLRQGLTRALYFVFFFS